MSAREVLEDAENLIIEKNNLLEIGTKINKKKLPKYQFMGVIKLKKEAYLKCFEFFKQLKNNRVDMTTFLNLCVKNRVLSIKTEKYNSYWYEIDTISDHKFAEEEIKKW